MAICSRKRRNSEVFRVNARRLIGQSFKRHRSDKISFVCFDASTVYLRVIIICLNFLIHPEINSLSTARFATLVASEDFKCGASQWQSSDSASLQLNYCLSPGFAVMSLLRVSLQTRASGFSYSSRWS